MTEDEYASLREARMRMLMSAKRAYCEGFSAEEWMTNETVVSFAKNNCVDDELEHFASYIWGHWNN